MISLYLIIIEIIDPFFFKPENPVQYFIGFIVIITAFFVITIINNSIWTLLEQQRKKAVGLDSF